MKTTRSRLMRLGLLATLLVLLLAGCGRSFGSFEPVAAPVTDKVVTGTLQYLLRLDEGPQYNFTMTLPDAWVGKIAMRNSGNVLFFDYLNDAGDPVPFFTIEALSEEQLWKQEGGYPGYRSSIINTVDTYFLYHLPVDAYYSGLPKDSYKSLADGVASTVNTFAVTRVQ